MSDAREAVLKVRDAEREFAEAREALIKARRAIEGRPVREYKFGTPDGKVSMTDLFGDKSDLIVIHNMGRKCAWCTMWAAMCFTKSPMGLLPSSKVLLEQVWDLLHNHP